MSKIESEFIGAGRLLDRLEVNSIEASKTEMVKGSLEILILSIIRNGETYGYEIAKTLDEASKSVVSIQDGTLYPALRRLEKKEFIESYWEQCDKGNKRRYYKITNLGKVILFEKRTQWNNINKLINIVGGDYNE